MNTTPAEKAFGAALMQETTQLVDQVAVMEKGVVDAMLDSTLDAEAIRAAVEKNLRKLVQGKKTVQKRVEGLTY